MENSITIVSATDNHYIILLAALIKSIETNHKTEENIEFYVIIDHVSKKNIDKINQSFAASVRLTIHWIKMEDVIPEGIVLPLDRTSYPRTIYTRLFIPTFLPQNVEKVIYLDVDMVVLKDISMLWHIDLQGKVVAAVQDSLIKSISNPWGGIKNYESLGLDEKANYFNTGLLIIDKKKWISEGVMTKVLECVELNNKYANYPDQYALNVVLYQKWLQLNPLWNCFANEQQNAPFIIHFIGRKPFYKTYDKNPLYRSLFYTYLNETEFRINRPTSEIKRYMKKILNLLQKLQKLCAVYFLMTLLNIFPLCNLIL